MKKTLFIGFVIGAIVFAASGCNAVVSGEVKEESISVKKDKAKELDVELNLGVGELTLSKGAEDWVEGSIKYNKKKLEPEVIYNRKGNKGEVTIEQKNMNSINTSNIKNEWNLELSDDVPMNLSVHSGASSTELDLQGLMLEKLNIDAGVGELHIDLGGAWDNSFETNIKTGLGAATVILPSEVGVKIKSEKGIGTSNVVGFISQGEGVYVNEAYENADVILTVNTEMGVGDITFKLDK
jgi:predicted membrane protein